MAAACLVVLALGATGAWGAQKHAAEGGYIFHLRNGSQIHTAEYWEEGNDYRIERFGGVIGLHKGDVVRIDQVQVARRTPGPVTAQPTVAEAPRSDVSNGVLAQIQVYVVELIEWLRAWLARIARPGRAGETVRAGAAQRAPVAGPAGGAAGSGMDPGRGPNLLVPIIAFLIVVPAFLFSGKLVGARLFGSARA